MDNCYNVCASMFTCKRKDAYKEQFKLPAWVFIFPLREQRFGGLVSVAGLLRVRIATSSLECMNVYPCQDIFQLYCSSFNRLF